MVLVTSTKYLIHLFTFLNHITLNVIYVYIGNNSIALLPEIKRDIKNHSKSYDPDDVELYFESWIDVEPNTGIVLGTAQKYLVSVLFERDVLFNFNGKDEDKFIPIYYVFRSGNYTEQNV